MAGSRSLKLSILGDVSDLNKSLKAGAADVDTFGDKIGKAGKMIGAAFAAAAAAAAAYAIKIGIDGVKAAIEDEQAQLKLATALEGATGATKLQIAATENYITKIALATGVTDDDLRPALARLTLATKDIAKAQDLLSLALDISAATGKPLEAVSNGLSKAYEGNVGALGKLGIGIDAAQAKTLTFSKATDKLTQLWGGAAAENAETYAGKIARVQVALGEAKETIGVALLPILDKLMTFINDNALPAITALSDSFSVVNGQGLGKIITDVVTVVRDVAEPIFKAWIVVFDKLKKVIVDNKDNFQAFYDVVKVLAPIIGKIIGTAVTVIGDVAEVVLAIFAKVLGALKPLINGAIDGINAIISAYNFANNIFGGKDVSLVPKIGGSSFATTGAPGAISGGAKTGTGTGAGTGGTGGAVAAAVAGAVTAGAKAGAAAAAAVNPGNKSGTFAFTPTPMFGGETGFAPSIPTPVFQSALSQSAAINRAEKATQINITVNGATNSEDAARVMIDTLNRSTYRGTGGSSNLVAL